MDATDAWKARGCGSFGFAVLTIALAACTRTPDTSPRDAGEDAAVAADAGPTAPEPYSCFTEPNGETNFELPRENPMNRCVVNPYPEGGDCYACALERCCSRLLCCGDSGRASFNVPYTSPKGNAGTQTVYGCIVTPMTCIQQCFGDAVAARGETSGGRAASREVVLSCAERCIAATIADPPTGDVPHPEFAGYARDWVECLLSDTPDPLDAYFSGLSSEVPDDLPRPFADTSCAQVCFPGY